MPRTEGLNKVEQLVLLALSHLGDDAYGMSIRDDISTRGGRSLSVAAVYGALDRLERAGLVRSRISEPTSERGGRAKKDFRLREAGVEALLHERDVMERMWKDAKLTTTR